MVRLSLVASLVLAFSGVAFAAPSEAVTVNNLQARGPRDFSLCGSGAHTIVDVFINPDQPKAGQQVTVTVDAYAPKRIESGSKLDVSFKNPNWAVSLGIDMCSAAKKAHPGTPCPIPAGSYKFQYSVNMPGAYNPDRIQMITKGFYGKETLFCAQFSPMHAWQ